MSIIYNFLGPFYMIMNNHVWIFVSLTGIWNYKKEESYIYTLLMIFGQIVTCKS